MTNRPVFWLATNPVIGDNNQLMSHLFSNRLISLRCQIPTKCVVCDSPTAVHNLCALCRQELPLVSAACRLCALPAGVIDSEICGPCLLQPPPWSQAIAALPYSEPVNILLHKLKYHADFATGRVLGDIMADLLVKRIRHKPDVIIPLPLHWVRLWRRGFNQATQLATPIAQHTRIRIDTRACTRTRNTPQQAKLNHQQRKANVKNAFRVKDKTVQGLSIALVDDVMTTGATARAACQALVHAGAVNVQVWVCARVVLAHGSGGIK